MKQKAKKIIPYLLILTILVGVGFFSPTKKAEATPCTAPNTPTGCTPTPQCWHLDGTSWSSESLDIVASESVCKGRTFGKYVWGTSLIWATLPPTSTTTTPPTSGGQCVSVPGGIPNTKTFEDCKGPDNKWQAAPTTPQTPVTSEGDNNLQNSLPSCGIDGADALEGCLVKLFYYIFFALPQFILYLTAHFFNSLLAIAMGSELYKSNFISEGWIIVRDLSNLFFILMLIYISIQIILDMGGHGAQKMIGKIIIMALLINFSMFFTKVIIDSSNILALVFYNKIAVQSPAYEPTFDALKIGTKENDIGGSIVSAFNIAKFTGPDLFKAAKTHKIIIWKNVMSIFMPFVPIGTGPLGSTGYLWTTVTDERGTTTSEYLSIIFVGCVVFLFASYAFFIAGISFLSRLIELWVLIIFSPFAFMSFSVPLLSGVDFIGWSAWIKRLLKASFMAPIFMFFLYLISKIIQTPFWKDAINNGKDLTFIAELLLILVPAAVILTLLLQATKFAKKWSGEVGEKLTTGLKTVGGLALGAVAGVGAVAGTATLGKLGSWAANTETMKRREAEGKFGSTISRNALKAMGSGSWDIRGAKVAGVSLGSATGMNLGNARKGGFTERRAEQVKKRQERAKELEVGEDEELTQNLYRLKRDLEELKAVGSHEIGEIDKRIEGAIKADKAAQSALNAVRGKGGQEEATARERATTTANQVNDLRTLRGNIKNANGTQANIQSLQTALSQRQDNLRIAQQLGNENEIASARAELQSAQVALQVAAVAARNGNRSMNNYEDTLIPEAEHHIHSENISRKHAYADTSQRVWERAKGYVFSGGIYTKVVAREAANKIRTGANIGHGGNVSGGGHGGRPPAEAHHEPAHDAGHGSGAAPAGGGHDAHAHS